MVVGMAPSYHALPSGRRRSRNRAARAAPPCKGRATGSSPAGVGSAAVATLLHLELDAFRNLGRQAVEFAQGVNLVVGKNGQGKTNLLEAIYCLAYQTSFRAAVSEPLVAAGAEVAALAAGVEAAGVRLRIELALPRRGRRRCTLDGRPASAAETLASCPVVLFAPDDLELVRGPAAGRRALLDRALALQRPETVALMRRYRRCLKQRNQLLKRAAEAPVSEAEHAAWEEELAAGGAALQAAREAFCGRLAAVAGALFRELTAFPDPLEIRYNAAGAEAAVGEARAAWLAAELRRRRPHDLRAGTTTLGPHRDDLVLALGGLDCRRFASQGQARAVAIALRVAQVVLYREAHATTPLLLLDDLFAELDAPRRERLARFLADVGGQVVITAVAGELPGGLTPERRLVVSRGRVRPA
ncbi:MAG: DNA replication and repair protein RecF [Nitrospirae bacterium]|nr:MAG: DNA replication and repair protein RecF [Nitrospirota bacterium]